jgi:hypothetical protein
MGLAISLTFLIASLLLLVVPLLLQMRKPKQNAQNRCKKERNKSPDPVKRGSGD